MWSPISTGAGPGRACGCAEGVRAGEASWAVERHVGTASFLHGLALPDPVRRAVWVMEATGAALALGSAQPFGDVDAALAASLGVDVVRRHSGGGAVLLVPGEMQWVDVVIPATDPRWVDDVSRSFHWLGEVWVAALETVGIDAGVHPGSPTRPDWSDRICFGGSGAGEVTIAGRKVVGMSQRRTRAGARFQCLVLAEWDPGPLLSVLELSPQERARARAAVADQAVGVGRDRLVPLLSGFLATMERGA